MQITEAKSLPAARWTRRLAIAVCAIAVTGCAAGPSTPPTTGTRYKGDAVWNISLGQTATNASRMA